MIPELLSPNSRPLLGCTLLLICWISELLVGFEMILPHHAICVLALLEKVSTQNQSNSILLDKIMQAGM